MKCNKGDSIYMITNSNNTVLTGGIIPLTTISRRNGRTITSGSNSISLNAPGYYLVMGTITFTAPAAGDVVISAQKNGALIPGFTSSATVTTAATEINTLPIMGEVRVTCGEGNAIVTLVDTGVGITVTNVSLIAVYTGN